MVKSENEGQGGGDGIGGRMGGRMGDRVMPLLTRVEHRERVRGTTSTHRVACVNQPTNQPTNQYLTLVLRLLAVE